MLRKLPSAGIAYAHCSKSRDPVHLLEKLRLRRKLRPALQSLVN